MKKLYFGLLLVFSASIFGDSLQWASIVNSRDDDGDTPLHRAIQNGNKDIVLMLIDRGADM